MDDRSEQRDRILERLRTHGTTFGELGRRFGAEMGLHTTDATALVEILEAHDRGTPLTQSGLSHRIGLTGGATSSLLNRLEDAGLIQRVRTSTDRRVVTLHATEGVDARIAAFFDPLTRRVDAVVRRYPPETLAEFERFLDDYLDVMSGYVDDVSRPAQDRS
jgi:DNA-binding MarR family transcriptional regulator